jgi:hypothetical protein
MIAGIPTLPPSTAEERACLAVRMAIRAFADGQRAADWLVKPNDVFGGHSPLFVAKMSDAGCALVCQTLDGFTSSREPDRHLQEPDEE